MRLWMLAIVAFLVMFGCIVMLWMGVVRQPVRQRGKLLNASVDTLILLALTLAAFRSHLPWNAPITVNAVLVLVLVLCVGLFAAMYAARLRMQPPQRTARATYPPAPADDDHPA